MPCHFCGAVDGDTLLHYARCSAFWSVSAELCVCALPRVKWFFLPHVGASSSDSLRVAGLAVVAFHTFNHCRNGSSFSLHLVSSFYKKLLADSKTFRDVFVIA